MKYSYKSRSSLFLMEIIIALLFFSIASAACLQLFVQSHLLSQQTMELNKAVIIAQNYMETARGTDGSFKEVLSLYPSAELIGDAAFIQYYDADFYECSKDNATYFADVSITGTEGFQNIGVILSDLKTHKEIYELSTIHYRSIAHNK